MGTSDLFKTTDMRKATRIPCSDEEAIQFLRPWVSSGAMKCENATNEELLLGWHALQYLFNGLSPDDEYEFEGPQLPWPEGRELFPELPSQDCFYQLDSGWPICFRAILQEMWHRYERGIVNDGEMYCLFALKSAVYTRLAQRLQTMGSTSK